MTNPSEIVPPGYLRDKLLNEKYYQTKQGLELGCCLQLDYLRLGKSNCISTEQKKDNTFNLYLGRRFHYVAVVGLNKGNVHAQDIF